MPAYGGSYEGNGSPTNETDNAQLAGFGRAVRYGFPYRINVYGDSTGNDSTDWPRRMVTMAGGLGSLYPEVNFTHLAWSDAAQGYTSFEQQQIGSAGVPYVTLDGFAQTDCITTPHAAAMNTTDIELEFGYRPVTVTADGNEHVICSRFNAGGTRAFRLYISSTATFVFEWSVDGTALTSYNMGSISSLGFAAGVWRNWKLTFDADNGSGGYTITLYRQTTTGAAYTGSYTSAATTTGGSTTSVFAGTIPFLIGARGSESAPINSLEGDVSFLAYKSGIGGSIVLGFSAGRLVSGETSCVGWTGETWTLRSGAGGTATAHTKTGGVEVLTLNGSVAGQTISYADDDTRFPKMTPSPSDLAIVNFGHNETTTETTWPAAMATFLSRARTTSPNTAIMLSIQNPQLTGATNPQLHARRCQGLRQLAAIQRYAYVDAYKTFVDYGDYATDLMVGGGDYVHPNTSGYDVWAMAAVRSFAGWQ